jgi:transglutaminase-like putative cysteine protease
LAIHVALHHVTAYRYDRLVGLSPQLVRLRPAPHCRTPIVSYALKVEPAGHFLNWQQDPQSNYVARLTFPDRVRELRIEVDLVAEMSVYNPFDFFLEPYAEQFPFVYEDWQMGELQPFLRKEPRTPLFGEYLDAIDITTPKRTIDFLVGVNQRLQSDISYLIRMDPGVQSKEETLEIGSGSCRDSTWLLVQLLRHVGLAARFVSGYLIQLTPDVAALDGPTGPTQDFTDLHAWCEVYLPGAGWVGLDPTSGLLAGEGHIPLSCTPEPASAAPITGAVDDSEVEFSHQMSVQRVYESPRVTKPYSDSQWAQIVATGHVVDEELSRHDVRLTMGGEPTFVSVDDRDGDEWNTTALGPTKRLLAADLLWRMRQHYGANGFVHFGQGKWYPGEQLPRWALGCFWRRDGEPAWRDISVFADERQDYGYSPADAARFLRSLATRLGVTDAHVQAGYEDVWYYLWRERQLPVNVDPFDAKLDDELERDRLRKIFSQGLESIVGHALPIAKNANGWRTGPWFLRAERMYLMPGDSPMGYRLPLGSLPWVSAAEYPYTYERDPLDRALPLPSYAALSGRQPRADALVSSSLPLRDEALLGVASPRMQMQPEQRTVGEPSRDPRTLARGDQGVV